MTATGVNGHAFAQWVISTNWAGGAVVTNATLGFQMQSNLTVQASFVDVARPTLTIVSPTPGQRLSNAVVTVQGTASDNVAVSNVWCQLNGLGWIQAASANNWTNWAATDATLLPGLNAVQADLVDRSGNRRRPAA